MTSQQMTVSKMRIWSTILLALAKAVSAICILRDSTVFHEFLSGVFRTGTSRFLLKLA